MIYRTIRIEFRVLDMDSVRPDHQNISSLEHDVSESDIFPSVNKIQN